MILRSSRCSPPPRSAVAWWSLRLAGVPLAEGRLRAAADAARHAATRLVGCAACPPGLAELAARSTAARAPADSLGGARCP